MNKTEALNYISGNPPKTKEPPKSSAKEKQDKPFRSVLNEVMMNSRLDKAYPTARTYEKEGKG